uniref:Uncharacterized protein n=1 Tax=Anguilla anguilla TaxID=7936 RepID=A0A0E9VUF9_ANGAN
MNSHSNGLKGGATASSCCRVAIVRQMGFSIGRSLML